LRATCPATSNLMKLGLVRSYKPTKWKQLGRYSPSNISTNRRNATTQTVIRESLIRRTLENMTTRNGISIPPKALSLRLRRELKNIFKSNLTSLWPLSLRQTLRLRILP
jgi:hypothetical protein